MRVFFFFLLLITISGCKNFQKEPVTLTLFSYEPVYNTIIQKSVESFNTLHNKKLTVNIETVQYEPHIILEQRLIEGKAWDLMMMPSYKTIQNFAGKGLLRDLTEYKASEAIYSVFKPGVSFENRVYALPYKANYYGIFYNRDIFKKYELTPPSGLDNLRDITSTLKKNNIDAFSISGNQGWVMANVLYMFISQTAGDNFDHWVNGMNANVSSFNTPVTQNAFEIFDFYISNGHKGFKTTNYSAHMDTFVNGQTAMIISSLSEIATYKRRNKDFNPGFIPFPVSDSDNNDLYADVDFGFALSNTISEKKIDMAVQFLEYLTTSDCMAEWEKDASILIPLKNNKSVAYQDAIQYIENDKVVTWGHPKIPKIVLEESKRILEDMVKSNLNTKSVIDKLDRSWQNYVKNKK
ncbi:MAG: hypothetical protein A2015_00650 [Spirochaetes bacterium GWF1_31_7]|nr:MAG: hypothetical protein A2Y30_03860 [Spirochaetes bacterium GWE1_32_154]OHD45183.1 MAG: hypothetical protein A2Y29_16040 [Spirochaetes bacterium GWE2_31_10]OHD51092.1 MAG: hypothetical protein A2015_00650 [Spirochaetes bacterium GWF1_31_7]